MEETEHVLYGEVAPVAAGESSEQRIITIPFDGTITFASYTPSDFLHIAQQGRSHTLLRDLQLLRYFEEGSGLFADIDHSQITLYRQQEHPMDLGSRGRLSNVESGDVLVWWSSSRDEYPNAPQRDQGDPGGIVKVVLRAAPGHWFT